MGQIQDIVDLITSPDADLETVLLRCKVLARRLKYERLATWVELEISGYQEFVDLPDYRRLKSVPQGMFMDGYFEPHIRTVDPTVIGRDMFEAMKKLPIYAGVSQLQTFGLSKKMTVDLTEFVAIVNTSYEKRLHRHCGFIELHLPLTPGTVESVISSIKSRLLNFLLEMEDIFPSEEDLKSPSNKQIKEVEQAFVQNIYIQNKGNLAIADTATIRDSSTTINVNIQEGNLDELADFFREMGISYGEIGAIEPVLEGLYRGTLNSDEESGVADWVKRNAKSGAKGLAGTAASTFIVDALMQYAPKAAEFLSTIPLG